MDLVMRKFKFICLQQACNDNACLCLPEPRADAHTRSTTKGDVAQWWCFLSVCKTLRAEFFRVLPNGRVALREVNGIKQPLTSRNYSLAEIHFLGHLPVANVNGWV